MSGVSTCCRTRAEPGPGCSSACSPAALARCVRSDPPRLVEPRRLRQYVLGTSGLDSYGKGSFLRDRVGKSIFSLLLQIGLQFCRVRLRGYQLQTNLTNEPFTLNEALPQTRGLVIRISHLCGMGIVFCLRTAEQLTVGLPQDNLTIVGLARKLAAGLRREPAPSAPKARLPFQRSRMRDLAGDLPWDRHQIRHRRPQPRPLPHASRVSSTGSTRPVWPPRFVGST